MKQTESEIPGDSTYSPVACGPVHDSAPVEWWFIQGVYRDDSQRRGHFMFSLFRHFLEGRHSASLLFRLEDSSQAAPYVVSRPDACAKDLILQSRPELEKTNLDQQLIRIYFDEIEKGGMPASHAISDSSIILETEPFRLSWEHFSICPVDGNLEFSFRPPGSEADFRFTLRSRTPQVNLDMLETPGDEKMGYLTYPLCDLSGEAGGATVFGRAWFDHQWGDLSWFASQDSHGRLRRLLGWEWFGMQFDDGRAAVALVHRDMETREVATSNWVMIDPNALARRADAFSAEPLRFWMSPRTRIDYPVEWTLSIPSLSGELIFTPLCDDQEIPVAGATRAIWEGAGKIEGKLGGQVVSGTARLELNGYGYVFRISDLLDAFSKQVGAHIQNFFPRHPDEAFFAKYTGLSAGPGQMAALRDGLTEPMWDLLSRGGKFWRPTFGILMAEALGLDSGKYEELLSVSTELAHLASLVIDDIEDGATTRRNGPSIHRKYGMDVAINAANTLYFLPMMKLGECAFIPENKRLAIHEKAVAFFVKAHLGQGLDLSCKPDLTTENFDPAEQIENTLTVYALKSAAPVEFITHTACILAGAEQKTTEALVAFARSFGVAFQIKDDIHDFGEPGKWTKEPGADLASGKLTYVILTALEVLPKQERIFLIRLLRRDIPLTDENINEGMRSIRASGALQKADAHVLGMLKSAWSDLCGVLPQTHARILLKVMCEHLLKLEFRSFDITA